MKIQSLFGHYLILFQGLQTEMSSFIMYVKHYQIS